MSYCRITFLIGVCFVHLCCSPNSNSPELEIIETSPGITWTKDQISIIDSIGLNKLPAPPLSATNAFGNKPLAKQFGEKLFFDKRLSGNGQIACSNCHQPDKNFTDGLKVAKGLVELGRNAPSLVGAGYQQWFYSDGRRDSLWSQAITPIESMDEMSGNRVAAVRLVLSDPNYFSTYQQLFGSPLLNPNELPNTGGPYGSKLDRKSWRMLSPDIKRRVNTAFANIGRAIAAYERGIIPKAGRLEQFIVQIHSNIGNTPTEYALTPSEQSGLKLFINVSKTQCLMCHNGPLLTNGGFHNIGTAGLEGKRLDFGRVVGIQAVLADEFNCYGPYSGVNHTKCESLNFLNREDSHSPLLGAYKVPSLRGLKLTAPYAHDGQFNTLAELMEHYRNPPDVDRYNHELKPLSITDEELQNLVDFLRVL